MPHKNKLKTLLTLFVVGWYITYFLFVNLSSATVIALLGIKVLFLTPFDFNAVIAAWLSSQLNLRTEVTLWSFCSCPTSFKKYRFFFYHEWQCFEAHSSYIPTRLT
jgi:hypothetical protein